MALQASFQHVVIQAWLGGDEPGDLTHLVHVCCAKLRGSEGEPAFPAHGSAWPSKISSVTLSSVGQTSSPALCAAWRVTSAWCAHVAGARPRHAASIVWSALRVGRCVDDMNVGVWAECGLNAGRMLARTPYVPFDGNISAINWTQVVMFGFIDAHAKQCCSESLSARTAQQSLT